MPDTKRWWNGEQWTDHMAPTVSDPELVAQLAALTRHVRSLSNWVGLFVALSILGGIIVGIAVASGSDNSSNQIHQTCIENGLDC